MEVLSCSPGVNEELGVTIVLITHQMNVGSSHNRVAVMSSSKVVERQGDVYDVFAAPAAAPESHQRFISTAVGGIPEKSRVGTSACAMSGRSTSSPC